MPDLNIPQPITEGYVANLKQEMLRQRTRLLRQDIEYGQLYAEQLKLLGRLRDLESGYTKPGSLEMVTTAPVERWFESQEQEELALALN